VASVSCASITALPEQSATICSSTREAARPPSTSKGEEEEEEEKGRQLTTSATELATPSRHALTFCRVTQTWKSHSIIILNQLFSIVSFAHFLSSLSPCGRATTPATIPAHTLSRQNASDCKNKERKRKEKHQKRKFLTERGVRRTRALPSLLLYPPRSRQCRPELHAI
jgi:hypothetical protein